MRHSDWPILVIIVLAILRMFVLPRRQSRSPQLNAVLWIVVIVAAVLIWWFNRGPA